MIEAHLLGNSISSNSPEAFTLHKKSHFGEVFGEKIQYSLPEALFLTEKGKISVSFKNKKLTSRDLMKKLSSIDKRLNIKYPVFKDLRSKGYTVKTALKFGADFRVYSPGAVASDKHAKWIVFCDHQSNKLTWHEFSAKSRVAHSTKKNLLLAVVDEENSVSYYEVKWLKP